MLAAGAGLRLRPLTGVRPKAMCPVGDQPLVDHALARFDGLTDSLAVNVHNHRALLESHLAGRVHLSIEEPEALGTAGALGQLRDWIDHRPVLVLNADTYCPSSVGLLLDGWDGVRARVLIAGGSAFGPHVGLAGCALPWNEIANLRPEVSGLYQRTLNRAVQEGRLDVVRLPDDAVCIDCGTPAQYLAANLQWSGGESVIGAGAVVDGAVEQSVIWPGAHVRADERLSRAIRAGERLTVLVR